MSIENPTPPSPEQEPVWPSLEAIVAKISTFIDTTSNKAEIKQQPDGRITQVCYTMEASDGSTALIAYDWGSKNTAIAVAYFRGDPNDGDYITGDILADYDRISGQWTETESGRNFKL